MIAYDPVHRIILIRLISFHFIGKFIVVKSWIINTHFFACFNSLISSFKYSCMFIKTLPTNAILLHLEFLTFVWASMWMLSTMFDIGFFAVDAPTVWRALDWHKCIFYTTTTTHFATEVVLVIQVGHVFSQTVAAEAQIRRTHNFTIPAFGIYPGYLYVFYFFVPVLQMLILVFIKDFSSFISMHIFRNW